MNKGIKLKIGIDGRRNFGSGIGRVTSNLIYGLINNDHENEYVIFVNNKSDYLQDIIANSQASIITCNIKFFSYDDIYKLPKLINNLKVDLFISPQFYISPFIGCKNIKMVHDLWPLLYPKWIPKQKEFINFFGNESFQGVKEIVRLFREHYHSGQLFQNNLFIKKKLSENNLKNTHLYMIGMMAFTLNTADIIIVPSRHTKLEIKTLFPEVIKKVSIIPNLVSPNFERTDINISKKDIVLHVSKWEPRKNLLKLINGFKKFWENNRNYKLILVGSSGYRDYGTKIINLISTYPYNSFIVYKDIISDTDLAQLYSQAKLFIFPSLYEGFGIPIIEAMASGTPVITTKCAAIPEVAGESAYYVNPMSITSISNGIQYVVSNKKIQIDLINLGKSNVQRFQSEKIIKEYISLINQMKEKVA